MHPVAVTKLQRRHWFQQIGQHFPDFLHLAGFLLYRQLPGDCSVRINADAAKHYIQLGGVERLADIHRKIRTDLASVPSASRLEMRHEMRRFQRNDWGQ